MHFVRITILPAVLAVVLSVRARAEETASIATDDHSVIATIAKTPKGLFADSWDVRVGGESTKLSGFRVFLNDGKNELVRAEWEATGSRVKVRHFLSDGSSFVGEAEIDEEAKLLQARFRELDAVSIIESGCLTGEVVRLYSDIGWVVERPTKKHRRRQERVRAVSTVDHPRRCGQMADTRQAGGVLSALCDQGGMRRKR